MGGLDMTSKNIRGYSTADEQIEEVTMSIMTNISAQAKELFIQKRPGFSFFT